MHPKWQGIRRGLAGPLSALFLVLSVAVPVLDAGEMASETVVESRHDPASCAPSHDHTVCTQAGANHALATREGIRAPVTPVRTRTPAGTLESVSLSVLADGHPTRAPPTA